MSVERPSDDELKDFMAQSGRALAHLHSGEHDAAIRLYEQLSERMFFVPNCRFLARAYASTGRVCEAITTLSAALEHAPSDAEIAEELRDLRENGAELLVRHAVAGVRSGNSPSWCRELLERNAELVNSGLLDLLRANAFHYAQVDRPDIVIPLVATAKAVAESLGGPTAQALAKEIEGVGAYVSGDCPRALALLREACSLATAASLDSDVASCLNHLGLVADAAGEYAEAAGAYAQALRYYEASGHQASAARVMENLASVYLHQGDYARAEALAGRAEQEYVRLGEEGMALKAMSLRGKCLAQWGRHNDALRVLDEAVDRGREAWSQTPLVLADALLSKSYVLLDLNRLKESEEARVEAQRMYQAHGAVLPDRGSDAGLEDKLNDFSVAVESTVRRIDELQGAGMLVEAAREKMNLSHLYTHRLSAITSAGADADPGDVEHAAGLVPEALDLLEEATAVFAEHGALGLLLRARKSRAVLAAAVGQATGDADALEEVLRELSELLRVAEDRGEAALAISLRQNAAQLMAQFGRVAEAAECIGNVDLDGVEPGEEDLVLHTCLTLAHLSAQAGDTDSARRMFLQAIRAYETQEERVGDPDYAVSWGKGAAHRVFDEAIEYLVAIGDVAGAYELVDRAKARVFQKALFSSLGRPEDLA